MFDLIIKPQNKKGQAILQKVTQRLDEANEAYEVHDTKCKGDARRIAEELTSAGRNRLIVVGGDGSLNDVLSGIVAPEKCTLGIIPAGTGNDFAASANIPFGEKALDLILGKEPQYVDFLSFADGRRSFNIAGLGVDVDILTRCERMKFFHNRSKYFFSLLASLCSYQGSRVTIKHENGTETTYRAMIAAVCNGKQLGGGIPLCPVADVGDGKLDLVVVEFPKRWKILGALIKLMQGKVLSLPYAHYERCERAVIVPETPCIAQYDGELREVTALDAKIVHGQLKIYRG